MQPEENANLELIASDKQDLQQACKEFANITYQVSPDNSYARGDGLKRAIVSENAVAMVTTVSVTNREYTHQTNVTVEVVHFRSEANVHCVIENKTTVSTRSPTSLQSEESITSISKSMEEKYKTVHSP